ncbi:MAG TPA: hemolysin family protein [Phycisphaerae bacterium]|nr:hemolysin family protein [Phycisphaerae bacterium]
MTFAVVVEHVPELVAMLLLTALSATISASETAMFSLTRQQLNRFRAMKSPAAAAIIRLRESPADLLATVLLSNIAVNILLYSILGLTVAHIGAGSALWTTILGFFGFMLVLFGADILPKLVALAIGDRLAPLVARPLRVLEIVTLPVRRVLNALLVEPLTRILTPAPAETIDEDELQRLINISRNEGILDDAENVLLHQLLDLKHLRVSGLMTPRVDMIAFDLAQPREQLIRLFKAHRLLRLPVYEEDIDNIQGIVTAREALLSPGTPIRQLIRPVQFIPEQAGSEALLKHFRDTHSQFAVVVDEYGGIAGVVALEDVVEAIVGELRGPEEKADLPLIERIDDRTYVVDAGMDVGDFCQAFELPEEETRIHTVGGLIAEKLDRLPEMRDEVVIGHARLMVLVMRRRRIVRVRVTLDQPIVDNPDLKILLKQSEGSPLILPESNSAGRAS